MSLGPCSRSWSTSCSMSLSPSPSISSARRLAKCRSASLRCAGQMKPPRAARGGLAFGAHHRRTAHRAALGQHDRRRRVRGPALRQHAHHLGDHIAGAPHHHGVADTHILARDFVHVVQRGVADGDAADEHRLEPRHRRQRAGAADLEFDVAHACVSSSSAGNLCAMAQRGARETKPSVS